MRRFAIPLTAIFTILAAQSSAQDYSAGAGLTTFGPTIEGSYTIQPGLDVRGIGFIPLSGSLSGEEVADDYTLDGEVETGAIAIMADYYPTGAGWRISGGLFFAPNALASGVITETATGDTFSGSLEMDNSVAPIITGGYRHTFDNNVYVSGDIGVIVSGFSVESDATDAATQADIAEINAELDDLPVYPFVGISVGFSF